MYKTGDILKTNCHNIPMCYHLAICVKDVDDVYVWHCTPSKENKFGGNIVCQKLTEFLSDREVQEVYKSSVDAVNISDYAHNNKNVKWDAVQYNCETFINKVTNNGAETTQLARILVVSSLIVGSYLIFKN